MAVGYILRTGKQGVIDDAALGNGLQGGYKSEDQTSAAVSVKPANGGRLR